MQFEDSNSLVARFRRHHQFIRYFISGCIATIANLTVVWLVRQFADYQVAVIAGAIAGATTTYVLTKVFVFAADTKAVDQSEILRFVLVHATVCLQIWMVSVVLDRWLLPSAWSSGLRESVASFIGVSSVVFTGFLLHRNVTYRKSGQST